MTVLLLLREAGWCKAAHAFMPTKQERRHVAVKQIMQLKSNIFFTGVGGIYIHLSFKRIS